jgi:serine phosphatase RsbU (regulator of sigma subunit)
MSDPGGDHRRVEVLAAVATALAAATGLTGVSEALVSVLCPRFADGCELALRGQDGEMWRIASGPGDMAARVHQPVPDLPQHPLRRAANGEFLVIEADNDPDQLLFGPPDVPTSARALGLRSAIVAPLMSGDVSVGALAVAMGPSGREFSREDRDLIRVVAQLAGGTVDTLQSAELQRRVAARLRTAGEIGAQLAQAQQADEIANILLWRAGDELGARSGLVYLLESPAILRLSAHFGHAADRVERWRHVPVAPGTPAGEVVAGDLPSLWLETLDDVLARYPALGAVAGSAERSLAAVRLSYGAATVGAAFWTFPVARRFNDADRGFLELIAEQAAAAIKRAQATEEASRSLRQLLEIEQRQRAIAQTLQASLLPRTLPDIDGFELHVEYWPALADMDVGGDFYDVFPIDERRWGLVIGDVCGKGAAAAAVTATARQSLRAAATHIRDETRVVAWVHDAVVAQPEAPYCTIAYAVLDLAAEPTLRVIIAGQDQGICVRESGAVADIGEFGTLLGIVPPELHMQSVSVAVGDLVAFYTDGLTDAPGGEALERSDLMSLLVEMRAEPLAAIGAQVRAVLDERRPNGDRDDTALVLLRRRTGGER